MTSDSHHSLSITDDEYFIALGRVNSGQYTNDDLQLIREWTARQEQERAELLNKLRAKFEAIHIVGDE